MENIQLQRNTINLAPEWREMFSNNAITQITVVTEDNCKFHCANTYLFKDSPNSGVCLLDNGDIMMYATHVSDIDGAWMEVTGVKNEDWGDEAIYFPRNRIKYIKNRSKKTT
ncbi:hypothetical protein [Bartonella sp. DGB1]|uniref:hypothetical protein n=1 Tax=Bartonella sp. DGB1 TaxID=3239807 RepID=UPI0035239142